MTLIEAFIRRHPLLLPFGRYLGRNILRTLGFINSRLNGQRRFSKYCASTQVRKLHIGCGQYVLDGWFNVDLYPRRTGIAYLDAERQFPYPDKSFDYVFCEHMIEHLSFVAAQKMLNECFRILKVGGKIRIATPDLEKLIALREPENEAHLSYMSYVAKDIPEASEHDLWCFVFNRVVRAWGHTFIYDNKTLAALLAQVGFCSVQVFEVGESADQPLVRIERHGVAFSKMELSLVETMVLEATR